MLEKQQFEKIAEEWLASQLSQENMQESLARAFLMIYRQGVVDASNFVRRLGFEKLTALIRDGDAEQPHEPDKKGGSEN